MARCITKVEAIAAFGARIKELQGWLDLAHGMHKTNVICEHCGLLYKVNDNRSNWCYCDYESNQYGGT